MPPSGHKPSEAQICHEKISCTVTVFMSSLISSFHSQLTRLTTLSWLIAPLRRDSRQCIQPRTVSPSWDCPGNSWQFSIKAATGRLNKPHLVLDRVLVPGYRQILAGRAQPQTGVVIALVRQGTVKPTNEPSPISLEMGCDGLCSGLLLGLPQ